MRVPIRQADAVTTMSDGRQTGSVEGLRSTFGIRARLLIPGRGDPVRDGAVVVAASTISWAGAYSELPAEYASVSFTSVPVVMPGMWDVHTHFMGVSILGSGIEDTLRQFLPGRGTIIGAITVDDFRATLEAGFTSVRELGGYAGDVSVAVELGRIPGPHVYSAFQVLSITGGHGDQHDTPLETVLDACRNGSPFALCDGVEGCTRMVRQVIRRGAKVIKICSTGGVL